MTGCGYGTTGAEAAAGSRGRVLAVDHGWSRHGRSVPAGWDHAQDRLPVACRTRGLPPLRVVEEERGPRYMSLLERRRIATLRRTGLGVRAIAHELGRSPSTVSRELRRSRRPHDVGGYDGDLAHHRARERARRPRDGSAGSRPSVAEPGAGQAGAGVEPGADRGLAAPDLPRPACLACLSRDDLPGHLSRRGSWPD
jgi:Helix-turn-helix domain